MTNTASDSNKILLEEHESEKEQENRHKKEKNEKEEEDDQWFSEAFYSANTSPLQQVGFGGISGCCAGLTFGKYGRMTGLALAGSMALFQLAHSQGYIRIRWKKVNDDMEIAKQNLERKAKKKLPKYLLSVRHFLERNAMFATGFAGGFLVGLSFT